MQFKEFAENFLGSKVRIKLIRHLLREGSLSSERDIAKILGVSQGAVNRTLKEFHDQNLISPLRVGRAMVWQLNKDSYAYNFLVGFYNQITKSPLEDLKLLLNANLGSYSNAIRKVVIYGSVAEGREHPGSDIDLFVLVAAQEQRKFISDALIGSLSYAILRRYGNVLSPNIFTQDDMENPKNRKFLENVNKGIVVIER